MATCYTYNCPVDVCQHPSYDHGEDCCNHKGCTCLITAFDLNPFVTTDELVDITTRLYEKVFNERE